MSRDGFQQFVNANPAPGMAGDFAGTNPRASLQVSGDQGDGVKAGPGGLIVGRFGWLRNTRNFMQNAYSLGGVIGFIRRENQALITTFLGFASEVIPEGFDVYAFSRGDFWGTFTTTAAVDNTVYANAKDGTLSAAAAGSATKVTGFDGTISAGGLLTVSNAGSGSAFAVGMAIVHPNLNDTDGPFYIVSLGTGSGGTGTYNLNKGVLGGTTLSGADAYGLIATKFKVKTPVLADAVVTAAIAATGVMTVSAVSSGALSTGQFISGANVPANTQIVSQLSGTAGGVGTYQVNHLVVVSSTSVTATAGKVAKISTWG